MKSWLIKPHSYVLFPQNLQYNYKHSFHPELGMGLIICCVPGGLFILFTLPNIKNLKTSFQQTFYLFTISNSSLVSIIAENFFKCENLLFLYRVKYIFFA